MKIPIDQLIEAIEAQEYIGFCVTCGAEHYNVEPDAECYHCEECEKPTVYGAEQLLIIQGA